VPSREPAFYSLFLSAGAGDGNGKS
jgi:hypothetical protein